MTLQGFLIAVLTLVHVVVALFVILLVLMQKSSEQGVGAAFGGGMTETVFGAGTTTALVRLTIWCAGLLLVTTLSLAVLHSHHAKTGGSLMRRSLATMPVAPSAPASAQPAFPLPVSAQSPTPGASGATAPAPSVPASSPAQTPPPAAPAQQPASPKTP
ncbi:MAG TPA: preprotein translocase subunit SecG [Verrucomicrobiae bacterium]|nr:preprotein translocase subunit SecG [Verrucomicrobiae bacterium]